MQGPGYFNTTPLFIIVTTPTSPPVTGLFVYSPTEAAGNLIYSIVSTSGPFVTGVSPTGDTTYQGAASYRPVVFGGGVTLVFTALMIGGGIQLFASGPGSQAPYGAFGPGQIQLHTSATTTDPPALWAKSPRWSNNSGSVCYVNLWGSAQTGAQSNAGVVINQHGQFTPLTGSGGAQLEIQNSPGSPGEPAFIFATEAINTVNDTFYRFTIDPNGKMTWGTGAAATDTDLFRSGSSGGIGILHTDSNFEALTVNVPSNALTAQHFGVDSTGLIYLIGNTATPTNARALAQVIGDTNLRWQMDANGTMQWGSGTAAPDVNLTRDSGGGRLNTNGNFFATGAILTFADFIGLQNPSTNNFIEASILNAANATFAIDYAGKHYWGAGGATATDTDLFRQAANTLATDSILSLKNAAGAPPAISGYTELVGSGANLPFMTGASGQGWFLSGAAGADFTGTVVTGTGNNLFGKQWTIDANDATANDGYEFDFQVFGKQGTTAQGLTIGWNFDATNIGSIAFPSGFAGIGAVFLIRGKLIIDVVSGGSSGGFYWHLQAHASAAGGIQTTEGGGPTSATQNGINATVSNTVQFYAGWGSTTGAPTMTSLVTRMRKVA